jgi:RNA polymerase sigma-70 factor (ECF subfamily)
MRKATDAAAVQASEQARVQQAIASLPDEFREVIVLREVQDLSYREIGDVVGVPIGTVMSRLARARKRLAVLLQLDAREAS